MNRVSPLVVIDRYFNNACIPIYKNQNLNEVQLMLRYDRIDTVLAIS
jgi:hypothetical protein